MSEQPAQEPTMEEILASIRRIISEDDAPPAEPAAPSQQAPAPAPVAVSPALMDETPSMEDDEEEEADDVLELTQPYAEPATIASSSPVVDFEPDVAPMPAPTPAPEPVLTAPAPQPVSATLSAEDDALLSDRAAQSAASAFGQLSQALMMPASGRSLEDVIKEMMRPMLKDWLDANLPAIVEEQVRAEVERIARRAPR